MFNRSNRHAERATLKDDDARLLFAQLMQPLEPDLVRDGMKALAERMNSPKYRRTAELSY